MYPIKLLHFVGKSYSHICFSKRLSSTIRLLFPVRKKYTDVGKIKSKLHSDHVLFKLERPKYFLFLNIFAGINCVCWSYLGVFLYTFLNDTSISFKDEFWNEVMEIERKYNTSISTVVVLFGWTMLFAAILFTCRSVRQIILHRGGRHITLETYTLPGLSSRYKVPLSMISAVQHRTQAKRYMPIKMKGKLFFFLLDKNGEFTDTALFDFTAGVKRNM